MILGGKDGWCCVGSEAVYVSLQMKIAGLITALLILVIGTLTVIFAFQQLKEGQKQAEQLAVQTAKTISYMPPVKEAFRLADQEAFTKLDVIEQMKEQAGAHAVYITDQKGHVAFHSARSSIPKIKICKIKPSCSAGHRFPTE